MSLQLTSNLLRRVAPGPASRLPTFSHYISRSYLRPTSPRFVANPQSGKPASDSWEHTLKNVKEEAGKVRSSLESAVAGTPGSDTKPSEIQRDEKPSGTSELLQDAKSITGAMALAVPRPAILWGAAGVLPYVSTGAASIWLARQASMVKNGLDSSLDLETASALLLHAQNVQVGYGAVILSFLGGITWGMEFSKYGTRVGNLRYAMGVAPLMLAWPSLLLGPQMALITQWGAYVLAWFIDLKATQQGWAPRWYATYRFYLSLAVGVSILTTLAGTQYYDTDESRSSQVPLAHKLHNRNKQEVDSLSKQSSQENGENVNVSPKVIKKVGGEVLTESMGEEGDAFVHVRNPKKEEEERKKKEEEERKKKEEEKKKKDEGDKGE